MRLLLSLLIVVLFPVFGRAQTVTRADQFVFGVSGALTTLPGIMTGSGTPEGSITRPVGAVYIQTNGTTTVVWVKRSGSGNTGWTNANAIGVSASCATTLGLPVVGDADTGVTSTTGNTVAVCAGGQELLTATYDSGAPSSTLRATNAASQTAVAVELRNSGGTPYVTLGASTLTGSAETSNFFNITGTLASSNSAVANGVNISVTSAGSSAFAQRAFFATLAAGYTGSSATFGSRITNATAGTGTSAWTGGAGNYGEFAQVAVVTAGHNTGLLGLVSESASQNTGVMGLAISGTSGPALNVGVGALASNATVNVAGFFGLQSSAPTLGSSAALIADNGATGSPIFVARDNGTAVVTIADGGAATFTVDPLIPDEAYGSAWNEVVEPPTKNAVYDAFQILGTPNLDTDTSTVGNVGAGEDNLIALTIAAGSLAANHESLRFTSAGFLATSLNNKRIRVHLVEGANDTTIFDSGVLAVATAQDWSVRCVVVRVSSTTARAVCDSAVSGAVLATADVTTTFTYTWANAGTLKTTGEATSNDDVTNEFAKVSKEP